MRFSCRTRAFGRNGRPRGPGDVPLPPASESSSARAFAGARSLDGTVLRLALNAAACARGTGAVANDRLLTIIDYSKASTEPRLWVLDLEREQVLFEELVAHGRGSGENFATRFSNAEGSHQTSLGLFRTADTYVGGNGYSLRLDGLEKGVNDHARDRAIVMHGAPYVSEDHLRDRGSAGPQPWVPGAQASHRANGHRHHQAGLARVRVLPGQAVAAGVTLPQRLFLNQPPHRILRLRPARECGRAPALERGSECRAMRTWARDLQTCAAATLACSSCGSSRCSRSTPCRSTSPDAGRIPLNAPHRLGRRPGLYRLDCLRRPETHEGQRRRSRGTSSRTARFPGGRPGSR